MPSVYSFFITLFTLSFFSVESAIANTSNYFPLKGCAETLKAAAKGKVDKAVTWRQDNTYPNPKGDTFETSKSREDEMKQREADDIESVSNQDFTPGIKFYPMHGVEFKDVTPPPQGDRYFPEAIEVSGEAVKDGILRGTIFLPVSGHVRDAQGNSMAHKWKDTDTFDVWIVDSKGKRTDLAAKLKSLDYVTKMEIEIPLVKGETVTLYYARTGSAGVYGFADGRTRHFTWK